MSHWLNMLFIYTLPLHLPEGSKFIILYIKQDVGMSATRLCKSLIYFCIFKETVAVLNGNTYYETPCMIQLLIVLVIMSLRRRNAESD